jgi:DNA-binding LacI/PurR family transcriptional regulator
LNTILDPVLDHAIEYFASCGCRQAALLCVPFYHSKLENFREKFAAAGIELKSENIQFSNPDYSWTASHCARLLFSESRQSFPDSLFIVDDNLVKPALDGMLEASSSTQIEAVKIACLANFPNELSFKLPVAQFGYDMTAVFHQVLDLLMNQKPRQNIRISIRAAIVVYCHKIIHFLTIYIDYITCIVYIIFLNKSEYIWE